MTDIDPRRLDELSTRWDWLRQANGAAQDQRQQAQELILKRYTTAILQYLMVRVKDKDTAEELFQEFAVKFVRGDFRNATPERGRFRDYLRQVLHHLVVDEQRRKRPCVELPDLVAAGDEATFFRLWREQLIGRVFEALAQHERDTGQPLHTVLRLRGEFPAASSDDLAEIACQRFGHQVSAVWIRNRLHFARRTFGDLLIEEVASTLLNPTADDIAEELASIDLLEQCREALERWRNR